MGQKIISSLEKKNGLELSAFLYDVCLYIHVADYVVFAIVTFGMLRVEVFHIIR